MPEGLFLRAQALPEPAPSPGLLWGPYPQRAESNGPRATPRGTCAWAPMASRVQAVRAAAAALRRCEPQVLDSAVHEARQQLRRLGLQRAALAQALAVAVEVARRTLGLQAHGVQIEAALHLLDQRLVEMATGEGKSLAIALAAAAAALSGMPVHVITANDYLVGRDAAHFAALFEGMGLRVGAVMGAQPPDQRRAAYARPVTYVTARELVFDYLRDRSQQPPAASALQQRAAAMGPRSSAMPLLQGLCMALVDEADSVLVDEAQMPLILSREQDGPTERAVRWQAWSMSGRLVQEVDFECRHAERTVVLTEAGRERLADLTQKLAPTWKSARHREHAVIAALTARHVLARDRDYIVEQVTGQDGVPAGRIVIVDAVSGRRAEGRRWPNGLHALVAIKEGCRPEPELVTVAQITYQRFFRRYHRMGGLSGTLREAQRELHALYGLRVVAVRLRLRSQLQLEPTRAYASAEALWQAVCMRCAELAARGRPVLVGVDSVADARRLAAVLQAAGLAPAVLDARQDADEANLVAQAGQCGRITVATQMAGRGTDIQPSPEALRAGGLHVLNCQVNPSARQDRQLIGRAARQGQPGSAECWFALDARRFTADAPGRCTAALLAAACATTAAQSAPGLLRRAWLQGGRRALQRHDEWRMARARWTVFRHDCELEQGLSFAAAP